MVVVVVVVAVVVLLVEEMWVQWWWCVVALSGVGGGDNEKGRCSVDGRSQDGWNLGTTVVVVVVKNRERVERSGRSSPELASEQRS